MIGSIGYINGQAYMQVNAEGTLEKLPQMKAMAELWLFTRAVFKTPTIGWVRDYVRRHKR